jgi:hypothetical protein
MTKVELTDLQLLLLRQVVTQAAQEYRYDHAQTGEGSDLNRALRLEEIDVMLQTQHERQYVDPEAPLEEEVTKRIKLP